MGILSPCSFVTSPRLRADKCLGRVGPRRLRPRISPLPFPQMLASSLSPLPLLFTQCFMSVLLQGVLWKDDRCRFMFTFVLSGGGFPPLPPLFSVFSPVPRFLSPFPPCVGPRCFFRGRDGVSLDSAIQVPSPEHSPRHRSVTAWAEEGLEFFLFLTSPQKGPCSNF